MPYDQEKMEAEVEATVDDIMLRARQLAAQSTALCVLIELLIKKGVLGQGEVTARYEALSKEFMTIENGAQMVKLADEIADYAAGRSGRKPS
jgi:hypothetical protein